MSHKKKIVVEIEVESHEPLEWLTANWVGKSLEPDMSVTFGPVFSFSVTDYPVQISKPGVVLKPISDTQKIVDAIEAIASAVRGLDPHIIRAPR